MKARLVNNILNEFDRKDDLRAEIGVGLLEVIKREMLQDGKEYNTLNAALGWVAEIGNVKYAKHLVKLGANIRSNNDYVLRTASSNGQLNVVKYLVGQGADIHAEDDYAIGMAALNGHLDVVKYLVDQGANVHANDGEALLWAVDYSHLDVAEYLKKEMEKQDES